MSLKVILSVVISVLMNYNSFGQNLVPNPGFENLSSCPTAQSQIARAIGWDRVPGSITTPDYFHSCNTSSGTACSVVGVPNNYGGSANANGGSAYAGVIAYYDYCNNCREYIYTQLSAPLTAGQTYAIGMYVRRAPYSKYATDGMGIYLSSSTVSQPGNQPIGITPHLESSGIVSNTSAWTHISGNYTATGGERYITIGNFYNNANTLANNLGSSGGSCLLVTGGVIYFVDDVYVRTGCNWQIELYPYDLVCSPFALGRVETIITGGSAPYSFLWSNGVTLQNNLNLFAGMYTVTVTDNNGCELTDSAQVSAPIPVGQIGVWQWTGIIDSNWFQACNWDKFTVPDSNSIVRIPGGTLHNPVIVNDTAHAKHDSIMVSSLGHLTIYTNTGGHMMIYP